jgi:hypothetical protein
MRFIRQLRHIGVAVAAVALVAVAGASARPQDTRIRVITSGQGIVTSSDSRIRCKARCSAAYERGAKVTLTASPRRYFAFEGWTGDCVGSAPRCIIALDRQTSVGAVFRRKEGMVRLVVSGPGVIISDPTRLPSGALGAVCGQGSGLLCARPFEQGTTVKLRLRGLGGGTFESWGGACAGRSGDCNVFVREEASDVSAAFRRAEPASGPQTLTVTVEGSDRLTSEPPGIDCPPTCRATYSTGTLVTLRVPRPYLWARGACVGVGSSCALVVDTSVAVGARERGYGGPPPPPSPIGVNVSVSGRGIVSGGGSIRCGGTRGTLYDCQAFFDRGTTVILRARPAQRARFGGWSGFCSGKLRRCTLRVTAAKTVQAFFRG